MTLIRISSFIAVTASALFFPLWVFVLTALLHAFVFSPYELLLIGVLIDAGFGNPGGGSYWYTAAAAGVCITAAYLRPYLSFYST